MIGSGRQRVADRHRFESGGLSASLARFSEGRSGGGAGLEAAARLGQGLNSPAFLEAQIRRVFADNCRGYERRVRVVRVDDRLLAMAAGVEAGDEEAVVQLAREELAVGTPAATILNEGLVAGMSCWPTRRRSEARSPLTMLAQGYVKEESVRPLRYDISEAVVLEFGTRTRALMPRLRDDLERLVRIPSIAFSGYPEAPLQMAGFTLVQMLRDVGLASVRLLEVPGAPPCVYAHRPAFQGAPTVMLYAHYDVTPAGDEALWIAPPFEPFERNGRLYGRGVADNKCGLVMHLGALRLLGPDSPVGIKVLMEGKEECAEGELEAFVSANPELLSADVLLNADAINYALGVPTLTTLLRGIVNLEIEVHALEDVVHSGSYGGVAPDALVALIRMLATLHDSRGNVVVDGLDSIAYDGDSYDETDFRTHASVLPGVDLIGEGPVSERLFARPSVSVLGLDAPAVDGAVNALVPSARALVGVRIAPNQQPHEAVAAISRHFEAVRPWNVRLSLRLRTFGEGYLSRTDGPAYAAARSALASAFGRSPVLLGQGGTLPFISAYAKAVPSAEIIQFGAAEPLCHFHGVNESLDLSELERCVLAEALLLRSLGS